MLRVGWRMQAVVAALALVTTAAPARASEPAAPDPARLPALLRAGAAAAKARQWATCIQAYTAALTLEDAPVTAGELGLCEEQAAKFADAHRHLRRAQEAAPPALAATKAPWTTYQAALRRVTDRVALLFVTTHPNSARVILDGRPVGLGDGRGFAVEPGDHTLAARLEGHEDQIQKLTARARDTPSVHLHLTPRAQPVTPPPEAAPPPAVTPPGESPAAPQEPSPKAATPPSPAPAPDVLGPWYAPALTPRGVLVTLVYAGVATTIAGGATAIGLEVDRASIRAELTGNACAGGAGSSGFAAQCTALHDRRAQRDTAINATVGSALATAVVAGAAGLAAGLERAHKGPSVAVQASPHGAGIVVSGAW